MKRYGKHLLTIDIQTVFAVDAKVAHVAPIRKLREFQVLVQVHPLDAMMCSKSESLQNRER